MKGTPLIVNSTQTMPVGGGTLLTDSGALQAPFRRPYLLKEIRFSFQGPSVTEDVNSGFPIHLGGLVQTRISLGKHYITNGFVPIWNLDSACQLRAESPFYGPALPDIAFNPFATSFYRWIFAKPLFVPAGQVVHLELLGKDVANSSPAGQNGLLASLGGGVQVDVAYHGTLLDPNTVYPNYVEVPYVTCWVDTTATTDVGVSSEFNLKNPFTVPLFVSKLVGRLLFGVTGATFATFHANATTLCDDWLGNGPTVKLYDSFGYDIIREYIPFNEVFSVPFRTLKFKNTLKPGEVIRAFVNNKTMPSTYLVGSSASTGVVPMISMIGHRMVPTKELA